MAVGAIPNAFLKPGDTVVFKNGGPYVCPETNAALSTARILTFRISGTPSQKINYTAESLWGFSFDGGLALVASNVVLQNLRIFNTETLTSRDKTNVYTLPSGINDYSPGNDIMHNLIENTGHPGIGSWKATRGKYIVGNVIRFVGVNDSTLGYTGSPRGSGMYLQNNDGSPEALIQGNISYYNYTTGMKSYGTTSIWNFRFSQNICAENNEAGIFYHLDGYGSHGVQVTSNYIWKGNPGVRIGYQLGEGGHSNAVVTGNYLVDTFNPFQMVDGWRNTIWTNNTGVDLNERALWVLDLVGETSGSPASHLIDYNRYYAKDVYLNKRDPFEIKGTGLSWSAWQSQVKGEANSTLTYGTPNNLQLYTFRPSRDSNFVHCAAFNWLTNATANVDLSPHFQSGDILRIYDAQAIPNAYTNFVYRGGSVSLDLTRTNRATMHGVFSQRTDRWRGFDPRFRSFVIYRSGRTAEPPSAINVKEED